jgi:DASS family divalent anion:Na+ symporter
VLLISDALRWEDALAERNAWDVFVWYGGLLTMGDALNKTGSTTAFAAWVAAWFTGWPWMGVLLATLVIYFYAHYAFASITTHMLAMFPPFVVMLIGLGTPPALGVYALACMANLTAGLTHYGTTTAPIVFAEGYVSQRDWWRIGFAMSVINHHLDHRRFRLVESSGTLVVHHRRSPPNRRNTLRFSVMSGICGRGALCG